MSGMVYLVGAGPGDPELLTLKGARLLSEAQVVVYDFLANPELLDLAPDSAERIYVGKKGGDHTMGQEDINKLLCDLAAKGKTVVRLKGGDPYVFGRGGEEASALAKRGLKFETVPGITSAVAAPSYAGIPVTDRRATTEVAFITGHEDPKKPESTIKWRSLAGIGSLVFLMGVKNLPIICQELIGAGKPADTPAATIRWGSTPRQKTVTGTLATLPGLVVAAGIRPPAITVVGDVVSLRDELNWFEKLPLFGRRILVTRARRQASRLSGQLRQLGAEVVEVPTIAIGPPEDRGPLLMACRTINYYAWVIFTSVNGVESFFEALAEVHGDVRALAGVKIAAIGPATAQSLAARGLKPDLTAKTFQAEGLLAELKKEGLADKRVLLPRAAQAREVLPDTLREWGAQVDVVAAYQSVPPRGAALALTEALEQGLDVITFTASSTVTNLLSLLDEPHRASLAAATKDGRLLAAAIGPITGDTAKKAGMEVGLMPEEWTIDSLVAALAERFAQTDHA